VRQIASLLLEIIVEVSMSDSDLKEILSPATKRSLADEVTERIREAILSGKLEPGARLREELLASSLNVSRGPVREALSNLEREGLVIVHRNRGTFVARLSVDDLEEVYSLRRALERLAVQRMIQSADDSTFDALQEVIETLKEYTARGITEQEAAALDLRFHDIIYQACRHRRLYEFWSQIQSQIQIILLTRHVAGQDFRKSVVRRHQELLDAFRTRDEATALAALDSHLAESYETASNTYQRLDSERRHSDHDTQ
jgi:DNA-binding GntR family transcriptional regulator